MEEGKTKSGAEVQGQATAVSNAVQEEQLRDAYTALGKNEYNHALGILEGYYKKYGTTMPQDGLSRLLMEMAYARFQLGDYDAAHDHAERALKLQFDEDAAHVLLGKIYLAQFKLQEAGDHFDKASADYVGRHLGRCLMAARMRNTHEAQMHLGHAQKAANFMREDPEFQILNIYVIFLQGDINGALSAVRRQVHETPKEPYLQLLLAEIFIMGGHSGEARAICSDVQRLAPQHDQAFALRAMGEYADEHLPEAQALAQSALERNPTNAFAQTVHMKCATREGDYAGAERVGLAIIDASPEYSLAHANLGDVFFNQGRYELARIEYDQTEQYMNSVTKGALLRKARVRYMDEDYVGAADILEKLIEIYNTYYDDAMCDLLLCYEALNESEKKEELMDKMELRKDFYHRTEALLAQFNG